MRQLRVLTVAALAGFLAGCSTARPQRSPDNFDRAMTELFGSLLEIPAMMSRSVDIAYCSISYRHKNGRWPERGAELREYVEQSNGYLILDQYERVEFEPLPGDRLQIRYVLPGKTNEMKFTLKSPQALNQGPPKQEAAPAPP